MKKQRHQFPEKGLYSQSYIFSPSPCMDVRTIKMVLCWRINIVFELWCWWRLLRISWTARRANQSILKEINTEYSLEGLMLKLKLQYFGHLMVRTESLEKTLILGKIEGKSWREWQGMRWLRVSLIQWTWVWANSGRRWRTEKPGVLQFMRSQSQTRLRGWINEWSQKCDGKTCSEQSCGANGADRLAWCRVATNLQFVENVISSKCNKRSTTKWTMPVSFHFI